MDSGRQFLMPSRSGDRAIKIISEGTSHSFDLYCARQVYKSNLISQVISSIQHHTGGPNQTNVIIVTSPAQIQPAKRPPMGGMLYGVSKPCKYPWPLATIEGITKSNLEQGGVERETARCRSQFPKIWFPQRAT